MKTISRIIAILFVVTTLTAMAATPDLEANKAVAIGFLETMYDQQQVREAYAKYTSSTFHNHVQWSNPGRPVEIAAHNIENCMEIVKRLPAKRVEIKQVITEGNMVFVHSHHIIVSASAKSSPTQK